MNRLRRELGISETGELWVWLGLAVLLGPLSFYLRFHFLDNPLVDVHLFRQCQTALTTKLFSLGQARFWDYRSPIEGKIWSFVFEFPLYQALAAAMMKTGLSLEAASRVVNNFFFFGCTAFLIWIAARLFGRRYAAWTGLLFFINPFNVVFSRTSLIDWTALFFSLLSSAGFIAYGQSTERGKLKLLGATLAGILSAVVKITIWYLSAGAVGLAALILFIRRRQGKKFAGVVLSLVAQAAIALAWTAWGKSVRPAWAADYSEWLYGPLANRLDWHNWKIILWIFLGRNVLHLWLLVPFLASFLCRGPYRWLALGGLGFLLTEILIFFNVHTYHDYYLISAFPFVFLMIGIGWVALWEKSGWLRPALGTFVAALFVFHAIRLPVFYASIFQDYRPSLINADHLRALTDPADVILYLEEHTEAWQIPLYSDRLATPSLHTPFDELNPTVVRSPETGADLRWFSKDETVWVTAVDSRPKIFWIYRRGGEKSRAWKPQGEIAVSFSPSADGPTLPLRSGKNEISTCERRSPVILEIPLESRQLSILTPRLSVPMRLPAKRFLSLPPQSIFGCEFTVFVG